MAAALHCLTWTALFTLLLLALLQNRSSKWFFFFTVLVTSLGPNPQSRTKCQQTFPCCTVCFVWLELGVREIPMPSGSPTTPWPLAQPLQQGKQLGSEQRSRTKHGDTKVLCLSTCYSVHTGWSKEMTNFNESLTYWTIKMQQQLIFLQLLYT